MKRDLLAGPAATAAPGTHESSESAERRTSKRFAVSASADVLDSRTHTRLSGRASDLGMGGCYVDTVSPFPAGTAVVIHLASGSRSFKAKGNVVYALTGMGMGISFTELGVEETPKLSAWLGEIGGDGADDRQAAAERTSASGIEEAIAAAKAPALVEAMRELVSLLGNKRVLSAAEVEFLRHKMTE